jgi:hypothetical protein
MVNAGGLESAHYMNGTVHMYLNADGHKACRLRIEGRLDFDNWKLREILRL